MIGNPAPCGAIHRVRRHPLLLAAALWLASAAGCAGSRDGLRDDAGPPPPPVALNGFLRLNDAQSGYRRPEPASENCLRRALERQPVLAGLDNSVRFAVMRDGSLRDFVCLHPVQPAVAKAIETAVRSCPWTPALDPKGNPLAVWVIQPIKVHAAD